MLRLIGKIVNFDIVKREVTLRLSFLSIDDIRKLEEIWESGKTVQFMTRLVRLKDAIKDGSRGRWFSVLSVILLHNKVLAKHEFLHPFHEVMKRQYFEVRKFFIGEKEIIVVPSLMELSNDEVVEATNQIIDDYTQTGVDFSEINQ